MAPPPQLWTQAQKDDARRVLEEQTRAQYELVDKLAAHCRRNFGEPSRDTWAQAFAKYDRNKDGRLTPDELSTWLSDADVGFFLWRSMWVASIFDRVDLKPPDGGISLDEFMGTLAKRIADPSLIQDGFARALKLIDDTIAVVPSAEDLKKTASFALDTGWLIIAGFAAYVVLTSKR